MRTKRKIAGFIAAVMIFINVLSVPVFGDSSYTQEQINEQDRLLKQQMLEKEADEKSSIASRAVTVSEQTIGGNGEPYQIKVYSDGRIGVWKLINGQYTEYQYYSQKSNGTALHYTLDNMSKSYLTSYLWSWAGSYNPNAKQFTYSDVTKDGRTARTTFTAENGITVEQVVEYPTNSNVIKKSWTVKNTSSRSISNVRIINGGDTYFAGDDNGYCYYDNLNNMVYVKKNENYGIMGYSGDASSPADGYYAGSYSVGASQAAIGQLSNNASSSYQDAGYYLQWNKDIIPAGVTSSWTVSGAERFTEKGKIQIINPSPKTTSNGSMVSYRFGLQNMSTTTVTVELVAQSINGYPVSIRLTDGVTSSNGKIIVTVPANGSKNVVVDCEIPDNAPNGSSDKITLTAKYLNGSSNTEQGSATNTIINYTQPAIARVSIIEKTDAILKTKVVFKNLTDDNILVTAEILDEQGRKVTSVPSQTKSTSGNGPLETEVSFEFNISNLEFNKTYYVKTTVTGINEPNDSASFKKDGVQIIAVKTITIVPSTLALSKNETRRLAASITPENATNKNVQWYSSDNTIAIVDAVTGVVTAKNDGTVDIYSIAKDGSGVKGKCTVTVQSPPERIEMNPAEKTLTIGDASDGIVVVSAMVMPESYTLLPGQITWEILDNGTLGNNYVTKEEASSPVGNRQTVKITAVKATPVGTTVKVKASIGQFSAITQIKVVDKKPTDITMKSGTTTLDQNTGLTMQSEDTKTISVELIPSDAKLDPADLIWSTNRSDLLTVTPSTNSLTCNISSKGTAGEATLTARINGTTISKTTTVKIEKKVTSFEIVPADISSAVNGQEINFGVKYTPGDATNKGITWSITAGSNYATIDQTGKLKVNLDAPANQTITIKALLSDDSTKAKTHTITTKTKLDSITIGNGPNTLSVGQKSTYEITYVPPTIEENMKGITWSVVDPNDAVTYTVLSESKIQITVKENAKTGGIQIKAVSKYDSNISATYDVSITQDTIDYKITDGTNIVTPTNGYYNKNVTLKVVKPAGYDAVYIDGDLSPTGEKVFTTDGQHKVKIYAKKSDGSVTNTKEVVFNIDNVKPTLGITGYTSDKWYNSFVNLTITSSDNTSTVGGVPSGIDQATLKVTYNGVTSPIVGATYTIAENGVYTFSISDKAGNETKVEATIKMDKIKPTVSSLELITTNIPLVNDVQMMSIISKPDIISNKQVTIKLTVADTGGSGISKVQYMLDDQTSSTVWTDFGPSSGNGIYEANITKAFTGTVKVRAIDGASNISDELTKTAVITDKKPSSPTITTDKDIIINANQWVRDGNVVIIITSTDASGLGGEIWYKTTGATVSDWAKYTAPITISADGKTTVYAKVKYSTGTESDEAVKVIKIDKTIPSTPTISLKNSDGDGLPADKITKKDVNSTITSGTDSGSGFDRTEYYITSGTTDIDGTSSVWTKFTSADKIITLRNEGTYTIKSKTYDMAGNSSVEATETFTIDRNQPKAPVLKVTEGSAVFDETKWSNKTLNIEIIPNSKDIANIAKVEYLIYEDATTSSETYQECTATGGKYSVDVTQEGVRHFKSKITLKNGNTSPIAQKTVRIDKTKPEDPKLVVLESYETDGKKMKADVKVIYNGDNLSGLNSTDGMKYQITDNGEWKVYNGSFEITMSGTSTTAIKVNTKIYDKAGNEVTKGETITLTYSELNMNGVVLNTTTPWTKESVTVSLDRDELIKGMGKTIKTIEYQMMGAGARDWTSVTSGSGILGSPVSAEGITKVQVRVRFTDDSSYTSGTKEIRIDKVDPKLDADCVKLDINEPTKENQIVITVNPTDTMSQIKEIKLPDGTTVSGQTADFTVTKNGTYEFTAYDNAGNSTEYSLAVNNFAQKAKTADKSIEEIIARIEKLLEKKPNDRTNGEYLDDLASIKAETEKVQEDTALINNSTTDNINKGMVDAGLIDKLKDFVYNIDSKIKDVKDNIKNSPSTEEVLQSVPKTKEELEKVIEKSKEIFNDIKYLDTTSDKKEIKDKLLEKISDILSQIPDDSTLDTTELEKTQSDLAKELNIQLDITTKLEDLKDLGDTISNKSTVEEIEDIFNKIKEKIEEITSNINKLPKDEQNKNKEDLLDVIKDILNKIETLSPEQKAAADSTGAIEVLEKTKEDLSHITEANAEKEAADIIKKIEELPTIENVSSNDKKVIEDLITKIEDLINTGNLKEDTKAKLEEKKNELESLLEQIQANKKAVDDAVAEIKEGIKTIPSIDNLNTSHKQIVEDLIKKINKIKDNKELTQEQKIYLATELGKLEVMLEKINNTSGGGGNNGGGSGGGATEPTTVDKDSSKVNDTIKDFINNINKGDLTLNDKDKIDNMLKEFNKLTDEQKKQVSNYKELVKYAEQMKMLIECLDIKNSLFINATDSMGFVKGYEDNTIRPDANITRAESAAMIYRLLKAKGIVVDDKFVDSKMWAEDAIEGLAQLNILRGYDDGTFRPDNNMTRAEFITMLAKVLGIKPVEVNDKFSDITGHWAAMYINGFSLLGYSKGYKDGSFQPDASISRAEAIVMINRVIGIDTTETQNVEKEFSDLPPTHWAYKEIMASIIK